MKIVIQKFGGTSVATEEARKQVVNKIIGIKKNEEFPVVVVSAMGRVGAPYATDTLLNFVGSVAGEINDREYDMLLACGEIISAVTMATLLNNIGYKAIALTGGQSGIITDNYHKNADLLYARPEKILKCIEQGIIPVVAGFQGMTVDGEVTTLGRGGSDTTASMLGGALKADRIEIFTDVDGIMTADPRVCEKANIIPAISYNEIFQMADSGAKVIHPRAVEYAMRANIPVVIKNTFSEAEGTYIVQSVRNMEQNMQHRVITGVAHRCNRIQFKIIDNVLADIDLLQEIAKAEISIDLINIFPDYKVFTIDKECVGKLEDLLKSKSFEYSVIEKCCKVTVIGERMTGVPGVMARIVKAFAKAGIEILQTADSLTTIGCLIKEEKVSHAVNALHDEFGL
ncbi:MAG: aspartate kinase [Cellulosilyticaceae bacterium]